jgi:hypothetical protein
MMWRKYEVAESNGNKISDEEQRLVYEYGKVEDNNFENVCCDVGVMKTVLEMMSEELKDLEVVGC